MPNVPSQAGVATQDERYLASLRAHWRRHKAFPPMAKLAEVLGLASASGVLKVVGRLVAAGFLERVDKRIAPTARFFARPVVRSGAARQSLQEFRHGSCETMSVEDYLLEHPDRVCYYIVQGDAMRDAGLFDGDVVVLEANKLPHPGDIVVADVGGQTTVRYLGLDANGAWQLAPGLTGDGSDQPPNSVEILGVVVGAFRRYQR
jgi:SOS-response transcriptional repressor LexA